MPDGFDFTQDWFSHNEPTWQQLLHTSKATRFLEIGSFEGRSATFLIKQVASKRPIELHCVDPWQGVALIRDAEARFDKNVALALGAAKHPVKFQKHKGFSSKVMINMLAKGATEYFDFVYVDGSHTGPDVLLDAVLAFELTKAGGLLVFDDYNWADEPAGQEDYYNLPKPAIDAFVNINRRKLEIIQAPLYQLYLRKRSA